MKILGGFAMQENWKDVVGYEGLYQVSNLGSVKRLEGYRGNGKQYFVKEHIVKQFANKDGYLRITLSKNNKTKKFMVHRLVAEAFIPNSMNLPQVNHVDENVQNNCASNLEWVTQKENSNHGTRNERISNAQKGNDYKRKPVYCFELKKIFDGIDIAAKELGLTAANISNVCRGVQKTASGYHFEYFK